MEKGSDEHAHDGREERSQQDRDKDIRRLGGSHLGTIDKNTDRYQRQSAGVEYQEHDHRVRSRIFLRIDFLQLLHRLQSQRCGSIVESQHIRCDIHEDATRYGMTLGYIRKQTYKDGR